MNDIDLAERLLESYIHQKELLLDRHGVAVDYRRMADMARERCRKMAEVVKTWGIPPDIIMSAAFAWAARHRHPDGPMPNMLYSSKYLTAALSNYLQVPTTVVIQGRTLAAYCERMDFDCDGYEQELRIAGVTDLATATSFPVACRYVIASRRLALSGMYYMAPELLEEMRKDTRLSAWLSHRGFTYEKIAGHFNRIRKIKEHARNKR